MTTQPAIDPTRVEAFLGKVLGDTSGMTVTIMASIGDRLGLFKQLAHGPASSEQLAARAQVNERYTREWLGAMASAGYVTYDPANRQFRLPAEHIPVLAQEDGPIFFGGTHHWLVSLLGQYHQLLQAFQQGGGIPQSAYDESTWEGMERLTAPWFENLLVQHWLPAMPEVEAKLAQGCHLADVGCGRGRALIKLAQTYPNSQFTGYDAFGPVLEHASRQAQAAGVADRVQFRQWDATAGLPQTYDVITTFDVVHDAANPRGLLRSIREALRPGGRYVCLEINCADGVEANAGPLGALFYSISVLYCMTTSLAQGGEGLGTVGLPEPKLQQLCTDAGFSHVRRLPVENPFNVVYEIIP